MKPYHTFTLLCIALSNCYANIIVDSTTLNGSFESGELSPWGGGSVVYSATNVPDGDWYAQTVSIANRASLYLFFPSVDPAFNEFRLTFSARAVDGEFAELSPSILARTESGGFIYANVIASAGAALSENWSSYTFVFRFSEDWDLTRNMGVSFLFNEGIAGSIGQIDQVVLSQVREPSLIDVRIDPASGNSAPQFNGTVIDGPALGIARLEASLDLGIAHPWAQISVASLDSNGSTIFTDVVDPRPESQGALKFFFRVVTEAGEPELDQPNRVTGSD